MIPIDHKSVLIDLLFILSYFCMIQTRLGSILKIILLIVTLFCWDNYFVFDFDALRDLNPWVMFLRASVLIGSEKIIENSP